ncbi:hypothetical protein ACFXDE_36805 [Kitasatospora sp. NPDC059408]|uniref:hypothetical protein n=1 Tax=Kitasatospora sp. NPDC059408 TaxID=3346823 RepID=UPI00367CDC75
MSGGTPAKRTTEGLLRSRIDALIAQIDAAQSSLASIEPEELRERIEIRLRIELGRRRKEARELSAAVSDGPPGQVWTDLFVLQTDLTGLFEEILALVEGAALRAAGADEGYCGLADALIDEIVKKTDVPWGAFTVLGSREFYARSTRVIRVRYPGRSFWELPVAVHELGHFLGPELKRADGARSVHPFEGLLESARADEPHYWSWLHEIFSDVFATHVLGPCYGLTCAFDRFDPVEARDDSATHPAPNTRMAVITAALDGSGAVEDYAWVRDAMVTAWQSSTGEAGTADGRDGRGVLPEPFSSWFAASSDLIAEFLPTAGYDGWLHAMLLAHRLTAADASHNTSLDVSGDSSDGQRIRNVVNAAWLVRLRGVDDSADRRIARQARRLIASGGSEVA